MSIFIISLRLVHHLELCLLHVRVQTHMELLTQLLLLLQRPERLKQLLLVQLVNIVKERLDLIVSQLGIEAFLLENGENFEFGCSSEGVDGILAIVVVDGVDFIKILLRFGGKFLFEEIEASKTVQLNIEVLWKLGV